MMTLLGRYLWGGLAVCRGRAVQIAFAPAVSLRTRTIIQPPVRCHSIALSGMDEKQKSLGGLFRPPIPAPREAAPPLSAFATAVHSLDIVKLHDAMMSEVEKVPYKIRKSRGANTNEELLKQLLCSMGTLMGNAFLSVDMTATARRVDKTDWKNISACVRSSSGATGVYFIQVTLENGGGGANKHEIIVAKAITPEQYDRQVFVSELAHDFFNIKAPKIRMLTCGEPEHQSLQQGIDALYLLHQDMYHNTSQSPKPLFESKHIMLMEMVHGKPLEHLTKGQRVLHSGDYHALGRLALFDLLIRNVDRFPFRKAFHRASLNRSEQGNPGNVMFGDEVGDMWAIDPEMNTEMCSLAMTVDKYTESVTSIVNEIKTHDSSKEQYAAIHKLFYEPVNGFLPVSLDELPNWGQCSTIDQQAIQLILQMITARIAMYPELTSRARDLIVPPALCQEEKTWRSWLLLVMPRAVLDIMQFVEAHTGLVTNASSIKAFESGFLDGLLQAKNFHAQYPQQHGSLVEMVKFAAKHRHMVDSLMHADGTIDVKFVLHVIEQLPGVGEEKEKPKGAAGWRKLRRSVLDQDYHFKQLQAEAMASSPAPAETVAGSVASDQAVSEIADSADHTCCSITTTTGNDSAL